MRVNLEEARAAGVYLLSVSGPEGIRTLKLVRD
jgi:hypothetical protein